MNPLYDLQDVAIHLPPLGSDTLWFYAVNALILVVVLEAFRMLWRLVRNKHIAWKSKPFSTPDPHAEKILILGDSTAVGTGATRVEDTLAGRLAHDFPHSQIVNLGANGCLTKDVLKQVAQVRNEMFSLIIVTVGGNDVWHFTRISKLRQHLTEILGATRSMSQGRTIFFVYNNIGDAPIFPALIRWFLKRRCDLVHRVIREVTLTMQTPTIELFSKSEDNPFLKHPGELFAPDGIHPSSRGYELWYNRMWREMTTRGYRY